MNPLLIVKISQYFELPEKKVENDELKKMLMESLEGLTEKEKKVILLYYYEELTLKEISISIGSVRIKNLATTYQGNTKDRR